METKTCAACGERFGCGRRDPDCWCAALPPLAAARITPSGDCYCPACLARLTTIEVAEDPCTVQE